jgi:hypothetical protein
MGDITFFLNSNQISIYDLTCIVLFCFVCKVALSPFYRLIRPLNLFRWQKDPTHSVKWKKFHFGFRQLSKIKLVSSTVEYYSL